MSAAPKHTPKTYLPVEGSKFTEADAAVIGPEIERIAGKGKATPKAVLDAARSKKNPLHRFFEWDDAKAAEEHRLDQARYMVRSINVVFTGPAEPVVTRAFQVIKGEGSRGYVPAERVFSDVDMTHQIVERAKAEASSWAVRYARVRSVAGLAPIFAAIEAATAPAPEQAAAAE